MKIKIFAIRINKVTFKELEDFNNRVNEFVSDNEVIKITYLQSGAGAGHSDKYAYTIMLTIIVEYNEK